MNYLKNNSAQSTPDVYCLMGPTAIGKTDYAIELVQKQNFDIISVDSAMVYKGLDIGSGKPTRTEQEKAPHRLIDICEVTDVYNAERFCQDAIKNIQEIIKNNKTPLLVGGTMMYFKALQEGLSPLPAADPVIREKIEFEASKIGWPAMHAKLEPIDVESFKRLKPNDSQRISRALEVYEITGHSLSDLILDDKIKKKNNNQFNFKNFALLPEDRAVLHKRIEQRFLKMLDNGLIEEVEKLYHNPNIHADLPAIKSVGYRQVWDYLDGKYNKEQMIEKAVAATRQLAKRQLTWLRSWPDLTILNPPALGLWL